MTQTKIVRYKNEFVDSQRWDSFVPHDGDIIVCTPHKNGTTWIQTIAAFLVYGTDDLDFSLAERSPWLDLLTTPIEKVIHGFNNNEQRNIVKTHTPFDGMPYFETATYLAVFRDPRDAFISFRNHRLNKKVNVRAIDPDFLRSFEDWVDEEFGPGNPKHTLGFHVHHLKCLLRREHLGNIHLFHYDDLLLDLPRQIRRVANAIDVSIDDEQLCRFADAASFASMKKSALKYIPFAAEDHWQEPEKFLNRGVSGQWKEVIPDPLNRKFEKRLLELAGEEDCNWLLNGGPRDSAQARN